MSKPVKLKKGDHVVTAHKATTVTQLKSQGYKVVEDKALAKVESKGDAK